MGGQLSCMSVPSDDERRAHRTRSHSSHGHGHGAMHPPRERVKILFLDVDGVLNGKNYGYGGVDDSLLALLKTIIEETGCKVVLSTTWRLNQSARATLLHFMKARADINVEDIIIGDTPSLKGKQRAFEIESFLHSEWFVSRYAVTAWVAVDDLPLNTHHPAFMKDHFIRTNYRTGITPADAFGAVHILNHADYDY